MTCARSGSSVRRVLSRDCVVGLAVFGLTACASHPPSGWQGEFTAETVLRRAAAAADSGRAQPQGQVAAELSFERSLADRRWQEVVQLQLDSPERWTMRVISDAGETVYARDGLRCFELIGGELTRADVPIRETGIDRILRHLFLTHWMSRMDPDSMRVDSAVGQAGTEMVAVTSPDDYGRDFTAWFDASSMKPESVMEWVVVEGRERAVNSHYQAFERDRFGLIYPAEILAVDGDGYREFIRVVRLTRSSM